MQTIVTSCMVGVEYDFEFICMIVDRDSKQQPKQLEHGLQVWQWVNVGDESDQTNNNWLTMGQTSKLQLAAEG